MMDIPFPAVSMKKRRLRISLACRRCDKERAMTIEIRDAALEARLKKQIEATGSS